LPVLGPSADTVALVVVVVVITYLSLVVGELVPKRIALNNPEGIAAAVAGPMGRWRRPSPRSRASSGRRPTASCGCSGVRARGEPPITAEEVGVLLEQGARAGRLRAGPSGRWWRGCSPSPTTGPAP
jgi:putative hemolysin